MELIAWRVVVTLVLLLLVLRSQYLLPRLLAVGQRDVRQRAIEALAIAVNCKDSITAEHVHRVRVYAEALGRRMGCSEMELQALREGALLHDVGKIGVPDAVLQKPGRLTPQEFELVKTHTLIGHQLVAQLHFPYPLAELIRSHHERFDGTGYPFGLKGRCIPLVARVLSVADCYDAYQHARPYKPAFSRGQARALLLEGRGTQFDPDVVDVFLRDLDQIEREAAATRVQPFAYLHAEEMPERARSCAPAAGYLREGART